VAESGHRTAAPAARTDTGGMDAALARVVEEIHAAQREIAAVWARADSPDGLVTATVNGGGELLALDLNPRIYRDRDTHALGERIVAAVAEAHAFARERVMVVAERLAPKREA
jgi:DNA-binding protein YbaB